jgi:hypothetical protein
MTEWTGKRRIPIVTAVMRQDGLPDFALNEVEVTHKEAENGIHYYLAEADLFLAGYEEPFVHFSIDEGPAFLHPAVRRYLGLPIVVPASLPPVPSEETSCPALSK